MKSMDIELTEMSELDRAQVTRLILKKEKLDTEIDLIADPNTCDLRNTHLRLEPTQPPSARESPSENREIAHVYSIEQGQFKAASAS